MPRGGLRVFARATASKKHARRLLSFYVYLFVCSILCACIDKCGLEAKP